MKQTMKVKKGDKVRVVAGADRGKEGEVLRAFPATGTVVVEGVNIKTKHRKIAAKGTDETGLVRVEAPVNVSNVKKI